MSKKKEIIHVGYIMTLTEENKTALRIHVGDLADNLRGQIYTAVHHKSQKDQNTLDIWYRNRTNKTIDGYIRGLYVDQKKGIVVAHLMVESNHYYVTLVHCKTEIPLFTLKKMATNGTLGTKLQIDRITVKCTPYKQD